MHDHIIPNRPRQRATVLDWELIVTLTGHLHIRGKVRDHPKVMDGPAFTTRILSIEKEDGRIYCITLNTRYEMREASATFEREHPGFLERLPAGHVPDYFDLLLTRADTSSQSVLSSAAAGRNIGFRKKIIRHGRAQRLGRHPF